MEGFARYHLDEQKHSSHSSGNSKACFSLDTVRNNLNSNSNGESKSSSAQREENNNNHKLKETVDNRMNTLEHYQGKKVEVTNIDVIKRKGNGLYCYFITDWLSCFTIMYTIQTKIFSDTDFRFIITVD